MSFRTRFALIFVLLLVIALLSWWLAAMLGVNVSWMWLAILSVICVSTAVLYAAKIRAAQKLVLSNQEGVALLNQGRPTEALAIFERCSETAKRKLGHYHKLFEANRAAALVHAGRSEEAREVCRRLDAEPQIRRSLAASWGNFVAIGAIAELLAPAPDLDAARRWLDERGADLPAAQRPIVTGARTILLVREDRFADVDAHLREHWSATEAVLPARQLRQIQLLWAYALHRHGREDDTREHLIAAGASIADESQALIRHWPELEEFIRGRADYRRAGRNS